MREILPVAAEWVRQRRPFAIATVTGVSGSAPREVGASMIVSADGAVVGNVSGGCVEGVVYERCLEAIATGVPVVESFGYGDAEGIAVGLTCGGVIEVLVCPAAPDSDLASDLAVLAQRERDAVATRYTLITRGSELGHGRIEHGTPVGETAGGSPDEVVSGAEGSPASARSVSIEVGRPARLVVVGAVEFTVALSRLAVAMGMAVSVVDPRAVFAVAERFPGADVVVDWPDRFLAAHPPDPSTAVCVLSHDPKLDVPALTTALVSAAGYVGAMGSRRTDVERRRRLREAGVAPAAMLRLRSPIGLDLGGRSPEETALSILAEIVADRHGGTGGRISHRDGPVHAGPAEETLRRVPGALAAPGVAGGEPDAAAAPHDADTADAVAIADCAWRSDAPPAGAVLGERAPRHPA